MPSKGIRCYAYSAVPGIEIEFKVPKKNVVRRDQHQFTIDHLEVESGNLGAFKFIGKFEFLVRRDGRELTKQWVDVNSMTGSLEAGTMKTMDQTPSTFVEDLIVTYGFYDAGPGVAGLPKQHQCYVTVTKNYENWMRDVIPPGNDKENRAFKKMVLPSAHDIGMNSMKNSEAIIQKAGAGIIKDMLGITIPNGIDIVSKVAGHIAPDIIRALAITQKDSLETILKIGARYFEFRPAKCHRQIQRASSLEDTWYFQHGAIPGMLCKTFLHFIVKFLDEHKDEIIVVQYRWDGVPGDCPRPSEDDLKNLLNQELQGKDLQVGNHDDMMGKSIKDLRNEKKRLIVVQNARQVSNYDDNANATLNGDSMVKKLEDMANNPPRGHPITLLQCQATSTNIRDVIIASVVDSDVSTSPILATKPVCDSKILPLLKGDTGKKLTREESLVVLMNDFFDGATADIAINMSRERLG